MIKYLKVLTHCFNIVINYLKILTNYFNIMMYYLTILTYYLKNSDLSQNLTFLEFQKTHLFQKSEFSQKSDFEILLSQNN